MSEEIKKAEVKNNDLCNKMNVLKTPVPGLAAFEKMDVEEKEEMINIIETQKRKMILMEEENVKIFNEKSHFKADSENAFKHSKDLELVFQIKVQDLNKVIQDRQQEIQSMQFKINEYVEAQAQAAQQDPQFLPATTSQEVREGSQEEVRQEEVGQEERGAQQEEARQEEREVDECVDNVRCEGNCEHVECHTNIEHQASPEVTCYDCKNKFKDKIAMMDPKRDSDHPSKRKCNQFPDCERGVRCWYRHIGQVSPQVVQRTGTQATSFTCKDCEQVFNSKNELMFHKKRAQTSNIICTNFLNGYCRRGATGEHCWYRHNQLPTAAPSVARPQASLPLPGSTSWNLDFPLHPTMGQSPVVGLQQQMNAILEQQRQQQQQKQQHQQQVNLIMSKLINMKM